MVRILLQTILCVFLLDGCYTYSTMSDQDREARPIPIDRDLQFLLKDGSIVKAEANRITEQKEPANIVFIDGERLSKQYAIVGYGFTSSPFCGIIHPMNIEEDSGSVVGEQHIPKTKSYIFTLPDSSKYRAMEGHWVQASDSSSVGIWCAGERDSANTSPDFIGRVSMNEIKDVRTKDLSVALTIVTSAVAVCGTALVVGIVLLVTHPPELGRNI